jgi:hypothetical protein
MTTIEYESYTIINSGLKYVGNLPLLACNAGPVSASDTSTCLAVCLTTDP